MTRLIVASALLLTSASSAPASLAARTSAVPLDDLRFPVRSLPVGTVPLPAPPPQVDVSGDTQVLLNGRRVEFREVPSAATVERVVLAADGKTIVRIEFTMPR
ncbi:hypothetical protein [Gemmata sp.]|uniref:hypothetical protein n=1 Tax=Gemmata sp. TaxID=1914242 RepID=UPI003F6FE825